MTSASNCCSLCLENFEKEVEGKYNPSIHIVKRKNGEIHLCHDCCMKIMKCTYCGGYTGSDPLYMSKEILRHHKDTSICCEECLEKLDEYGKTQLLKGHIKNICEKKVVYTKENSKEMMLIKIEDLTVQLKYKEDTLKLLEAKIKSLQYLVNSSMRMPNIY